MSNRPIYEKTGILFKNDKEGNDQRPDYKGNITFNGEEFDLAGWIRQGKKGSFMSLKVSERRRPDVSGQIDDKPKSERKERQAPPVDDGFDDDIPF